MLFSPCRRLALALLVALCPSATAAAPPPAAPKIVAIDLADPVMHRNQHTRWSVTTSPNVARVVALVQGRTVPLAQVAPGRFAVDFTVPWYVPFWYNKAWELRFSAYTASGAHADQTVRIELR